MDRNERNRIVSWIEESMNESGFSKMVIELMGTNEKGEGYVADFMFAEVTDEDDENRKVHLAIKMGKNSEILRERLPMMRELCKRELFVYEKVFPTFRKFQSEKNIVNTFDSYPKCYKTFLTDNMEVLVLENLKKRGFALHNIKNPLNLPHIHLVLKNYAKLHALSFALRDQNKEKFNELTTDYASTLRPLILATGMFRTKGIVQEKLRKGGRNDLVEKYEEEIKRGKETIILEIIDDVIKETVITHGDCHNNNFLFQYKDNDDENPLDVAIIDWQCSSLHSPALDLSCFLYFCSSGDSLSRLDELLKLYHTHLKIFLRELGSDVEKLFPYSTLVKHWRKYCPYAFVGITTFLQIWFFEKEDVVLFEDVNEQGEMGIPADDIKFKDEDLYLERLISVIDHHCNFIMT